MQNRLKSSYPLLVLIRKKWQAHIYIYMYIFKTLNTFIHFTLTLQFFNSKKTSWGSSIFKKSQKGQSSASQNPNPHLMAPTLLRWKVERIRTWRVVDHQVSRNPGTPPRKDGPMIEDHPDFPFCPGDFFRFNRRVSFQFGKRNLYIRNVQNIVKSSLIFMADGHRLATNFWAG